MRKNIKKAICIIFCVAMLLGCLPAMHVHVHADGDGDITVTVDGGTAVFVGKNAEFQGLAAKGDVLFVSLTEQETRVFKRWETPTGTVITDPSFKMTVGVEEHLYAVFEDTDDYPFGEWTLIREGNCAEGVLYKAENTKGDVRYKLEYVNGGRHSFPEHPEYVDETVHRSVCSVCGYVKESEHGYSDEFIETEPTHSAGGLKVSYCYDCMHRIETPLPRTDEHSFDGTWTVVEPSVNGQYGKRMRKCRYCDYTETYWYLDLDLKSLLKDKYVEFTVLNSNTVTHDEQYYSFTREDGCDVYVFATQYQYAYGGSRDNDQTWIFMYVDDHVEDNLDPVYLTKSYRRGGGRGEIKWAKYGYVYGVDGWIEGIGRLDYMFGNCNDIGASNTMSARDSTLVSFGKRWVDTYNDMMIPVTSDPESFLVENGSEYGWYIVGEDIPTACWSVEDNGCYSYAGGFMNTVAMRRIVAGNGTESYPYRYESVTVDKNSGLTLNMSQEIQSMRFYTDKYYDIVTAEEYEHIEEEMREGFVPVDTIADRLRGFSGSNARNQISTPFTLDEPEELSAVRFICYKDYIGDQWDQYTNDGRLFYITKNADYPQSIELSWDADNNTGRAFEGWYRWDFTSGEWQFLSADTVYTVNTAGDPFTDLTIVTAKYHEVTVYNTLTVEGGYFTFAGDDTHYTAAQIEYGTMVTLHPNLGENERLDVWTTSEGDVYYDTEPDIVIENDVTFVAAVTERTAGVNVCTYDCNGNVWQVGSEDEKDTYINRQGTVGSVMKFRTEGTGEYDQFLGWYLKYYGKSGETYTLLTTDEEYEYTVIEFPEFDCIVAVWSDGSVSVAGEPERIKVSVENGFAILPSEDGETTEGKLGEDTGEYRYNFNAFSTQDVLPYSELIIIDDPTDDVIVRKWSVEYVFFGEPNSYENDVDPEYDMHVWVESAEVYTDKTITVTGSGTQKCADDAHEWDEGIDVSEPTHASAGKRKYACTVCGDVKYETIPRLDHTITTVAAVPATCTDAGNSAYYICEQCGKWYSDADAVTVIEDHSSVVIAAKGHTPKDPVRENETPATHSADGSYDLVTYCGVCGAELSREPKSIPALQYMPGDINDDGAVNVKDLIRLAQYIAKWNVTVVAEALDVNGDTEINVKDLIRLAQYVAKWNVEIF
ncbi:MAG: dockerin type I repeat-containing protein [Clostridia bacterium]|nr:dockerin type I repeat-containing protein [Clostridia bacterium]